MIVGRLAHYFCRSCKIVFEIGVAVEIVLRHATGPSVLVIVSGKGPGARDTLDGQHLFDVLAEPCVEFRNNLAIYGMCYFIDWSEAVCHTLTRLVLFLLTRLLSGSAPCRHFLLCWFFC
jgi:hypothetical protein